ncbi:DUF418 domain-containing protein [Dysgonomonas sp. HGC4]|uniref:DUF418 domain-containing protein n=1 Tax=Dysgonomonas sp. HGC4 TaxID=1658009 RepID=UPI000681AD5A|nr:DUF418 domain-containing protein [Dysgonomonas sp. HGC4]MBD8348682.1 DUF418 domain-containing protein [Dysgonomonas sp. HGC4]
MQQELTEKTPRIEMVDALRGFAVIAIVLIHSVEHFIYPVYPDPITQPEWLNILDKGVFSIIFSLIAGKGYAIFSILFGFTFAIQFKNQQNKGNDFGVRFLWRLLLLAGFATLNAMFFPGGDVLLLYAIVGVILFVVRKWNDKAIFIIMILLLLQPMQWFYYISGLINPEFSLPENINGALYAQIIEINKSGEFFPFIWANITTGQLASFLWAVEGGRFLQTAGLFLLGLLISRRKLFNSTPENIKFWTKTLILCAILFAPMYQLKVELFDTNSDLFIKNTVGVMFDMWQKLLFTFVLIGSFIILYQKEAFQRKISWFRVYGKMSLTNYISQSFIGALIFFPIGLNLSPYCGFTNSLIVGCIIVALQLQFCKWWQKSHKQGPLEKIWHKLTWIGQK